MICIIPAARKLLLYKINKKPVDIPLTLPFIEWYIINNKTRMDSCIYLYVVQANKPGCQQYKKYTGGGNGYGFTGTN